MSGAARPNCAPDWLTAAQRRARRAAGPARARPGPLRLAALEKAATGPLWAGEGQKSRRAQLALDRDNLIGRSALFLINLPKASPELAPIALTASTSS